MSDEFNPEAFEDDAEDFAADDPEIDYEAAVAIEEALAPLAEIEDPSERYLTSVQAIKGLFGEDLVIL